MKTDKHRKITIVLGLILTITCLFLFQPITAYSQPKEIVLKYGSYAPRVPHDEPMIWWAEEVSKRSGIKIKYEFYWAQALAKAVDCFKALGAGVYDIGWVSPIFTAGRTPYLAVANATPLTTSSIEAICAAEDELANTGPGKEELEKANTKFLFSTAVYDYKLIGKKPVEKVEDIKNYRSRTFGYLSLAWKKLGGVPISMPQPEVYQALQAGLLDGVLHQPGTFVKGKYFEVAKHYTPINFGSLPMPFIMNMKKWKSLPAGVQKTMLEVAKEMPRRAAEIIDSGELKAIEDLKGKDVVFHEMSDESRAKIRVIAEEVWKDIAADLDKKGLPGSKAIDLWIKLVKKYDKKM